MTRLTKILCTVALLGAWSRVDAQVTSTLQSIVLSASKNQSVTLTAPTPSTQFVTLMDGVANPFPAPFSTTVGWDVSGSVSTTVKLVAYFATPSAAMTNGTDLIPSSMIEVSIDGGTTWFPVTDNSVGGIGATGGSRVLYTSAVTSGGNRQGSAAVTFSVRINLASTNVRAGMYSGTLNLMAICN